MTDSAWFSVHAPCVPGAPIGPCVTANPNGKGQRTYPLWSVNKLAVSYLKKNHFTRAELQITGRISKLDTVRCMVDPVAFCRSAVQAVCTELDVTFRAIRYVFCLSAGSFSLLGNKKMTSEDWKCMNKTLGNLSCPCLIQVLEYSDSSGLWRGRPIGGLFFSKRAAMPLIVHFITMHTGSDN